MSTDVRARLAHVFLDIRKSYDAAATDHRESVPLLIWANFLRAIPDEGIDQRDLVRRVGISRRALRFWLGVERLGWLHVSSREPRRPRVTLTDDGRRRRDHGARCLADVERTWHERIGDDGIALRAALERFVGSLVLELPHYPMPYGAADGRILGGSAVAAKAGPPRIPAHGSEWPIVLRRDAGSVIKLPLHPLVGQALTAFLIDDEVRGDADDDGFVADTVALRDLDTQLRTVDERLDDDLPDRVVVGFLPGRGFVDVS